MNFGLRQLCCLLAVSVAPGWASAQHVDMLFARDTGGTQLVTGTADFGNNNYTVGARVFEGEFDPAFLSSDPGFNAVAQASLTGGLALPGNTALRFNILPTTIGSTTSNLFFWNGTGAVNFQGVAAGYSLEVSKAGGFSAIADGTGNQITGFNINDTSSTGFIHKHLDFALDDGTAGDPAAGIYLLALEATMTGLADSDPFFIVFATDGTAESVHESAVEWVNENLTSGVPEPSTYLLVGLPLLAFAIRRYGRGWWAKFSPVNPVIA